MNNGAFFTHQYPNLFVQLGISEKEIEKKIKDTFETIFFDPAERFLFLKRAKVWDI
jgi:oligosaccharide reducing-end xylanase